MAVTCINGLVAILSLRSVTKIHESVVDTRSEITDTAAEIKSHSYDQARAITQLRTPIAPIDPEQHPAFDRAREDIAAGRYGEAQRGLYSLLAVVDRLDEESRSAVEARAHFLLAEAMHLEAVDRLGEER